MAAGGRHFVRGTKLGHGPAGFVYGFDGKDRSGVGDEKWPNSWLLSGEPGCLGITQWSRASVAPAWSVRVAGQPGLPSNSRRDGGHATT